MQKGKVFSTIWKELKHSREVEILVHDYDVSRYTESIKKNKHRDVGFNLQFPSARLAFEYKKQFNLLCVKLLKNPLDDIAIDKL